MVPVDRTRRLTGHSQMVFLYVQAVIGWLFILVGLVLWPLPLPFGLIMLIIGIALVVPTSPGMRRLLRGLRKRYPVLDRQLERMRPHLPKFMRTMIERTRPRDQNGDTTEK